MLPRQVLANHLLLRRLVLRPQRTFRFQEEGAQCRHRQQERQLQDFSHIKTRNGALRRAKIEAQSLERWAKPLLVLHRTEATAGVAIRPEGNLHQILRARAEVNLRDNSVVMQQVFASVPAHQRVRTHYRRRPKLLLLVRKQKSLPLSRLLLALVVKMAAAKR